MTDEQPEAKELLIKALESLNARLAAIEAKLATPQPVEASKPNLDPAQLAQMMSMFGGGEQQTNSMDDLFKELGKRAFYNVFDKLMPSKSEVRHVHP